MEASVTWGPGSRRSAFGIAAALLAALCLGVAPTGAHHDPNGQGGHGNSNGNGHDKHPGPTEEPPPPPPPPPPGEEPPPPPPPPSEEPPPAEPGAGAPPATASGASTPPQPAPGGASVPSPTEVPDGATTIDGATAPVAGATEVVDPVRGRVRYRLPGTNEYVELPEARNLPNGTEVDARFGIAEVFVSDGRGGFDSILAWAGRFVLTNRIAAGPENASRTLTELTLSGRIGRCAPAASRRSTRAAARRSRRLWSKTSRGRFRTRGRFSSATVRGTRWLTLDACDARGPRSTVLVDEGTVIGRDLIRGTSRAVSAGERLTVRP